jgi:DNA/RNA non-specific endonuclease
MPVLTAYIADAQGRPWRAVATITQVGDAAGGTAATVPANQVQGYQTNAHPYHHERGHLIGKQLGGDGGSAQNLVGLSDGTNAPLMSDIEGFCRDVLVANPGGSVILTTTVDYTNTHYNGTAAAPFIAGMVGAIQVVISHTDGTQLFSQTYPNGVVKNHPADPCGC